MPEDPDSGQVQAARDFLLTTFLGDLSIEVSARTRRLPRPARHPDPAQLPAYPDPVRRGDLHHARLGQSHPDVRARHAAGQRVLTWTRSDEELRKAITSVLADPVARSSSTTSPRAPAMTSPCWPG